MKVEAIESAIGCLEDEYPTDGPVAEARAQLAALVAMAGAARDALMAYATGTDWEVAEAMRALNRALGDPLDIEEHEAKGG